MAWNLTRQLCMLEVCKMPLPFKELWLLGLLALLKQAVIAYECGSCWFMRPLTKPFAVLCWHTKA
jgi:hypothetical protein